MTHEILRQDEHPDRLTIEPLRNRTIAVLGYGNQGCAHALNMRDSGLEVTVGNRPDSPRARRAVQDGFTVVDIPEAVASADLVILALPDEVHGDVFENQIRNALRPKSILGFLHGFSVRYGRVDPPDDNPVVMVAPKGPGTLLRQLYRDGKGLPCLLAVQNDSKDGAAETIALAWATAIGCGRAGVIRTTFADEAETDLFGEQAVLCGGMTALMATAFEMLVDRGYPPHLAYLECCHEMKQVADLVYERGLAGMFTAISNTAEFGAYTAASTLVDDAFRARLRELLENVRSGAFAQSLHDDYAKGFPWFQEQRARRRDHPIEPAGAIIRALMPWLSPEDAPQDGAPDAGSG